MTEPENNVLLFPSPEDREVERLVEAFMRAHAGDEMVVEIAAYWSIRGIVEEVAADEEIELAPEKPIDTALLKLHYYQDPLSGMVPRNELSFGAWRWNVEELKRRGETDHARALDAWGLYHFYAIVERMLADFVDGSE